MKQAKTEETRSTISNINFWAYVYFYMMAVTLVSCGLTYIGYRIKFAILAVAFCVILAGIIILWNTKLSRKLLYLLDIINILGTAVAGNMIMYLINGSRDITIGLLCGVALMDVFSFTRAGRSTLNAKLSGKNDTLARLSICMPIPGRKGLQPLIGVGDLTYYSLMMSFSLTVKGAPTECIAVALITAGQLINILFISIFKRSSRYKGFPATFFPGLLYIAALFIL